MITALPECDYSGYLVAVVAHGIIQSGQFSTKYRFEHMQLLVELNIEFKNNNTIIICITTTY